MGEWFVDTTFGIPCYQDVLVKGPLAQVLEATFKDAILATEGVRALLSFELAYDPARRTLELSFRVTADEGVLDVTEVLP